ncbi:hypothetical protein KUV50_17990 [Membranicola marinus]|uniref:Tyr recombinase domain-containing protein n=1 Tax=Membranihabitans marinus TaxID=1227546 RepID=A0A953HYD2_9BACT|nr:hypothetical protein [Membranihabitans marinus]MBY5960048.1 hypothetical protein [Membranihabitans marinus]
MSLSFAPSPSPSIHSRSIFYRVSEAGMVTFLCSKVWDHLHILKRSIFPYNPAQGTDLRIDHELMGHKDLKTTMSYAHVGTTRLEKTKNPFNDLIMNNFKI